MNRIMNRRWFVATVFTALALASAAITVRTAAQDPAPGTIGSSAQSAQVPAPGSISSAESAQAPAPGPTSSAESAPVPSPGPISSAESAQAPAPGPIGSSGEAGHGKPTAQAPAPVTIGSSAKAGPGNKQLGLTPSAQEPAPVTIGSSGLPTGAGPGNKQSPYPLGPTPADVTVEHQSLVAHHETRKLIQAYRLTQDESEKARIVKELPILVAKQFDARQQDRERELKQLEEQLRKLQELHQRRNRQRDQIVEERVRQLLRDADGVGWGSDDDVPASTSANDPFSRGVTGYGAAEQSNHSNNPYPATNGGGKPEASSAAPDSAGIGSRASGK